MEDRQSCLSRQARLPVLYCGRSSVKLTFQQIAEMTGGQVIQGGDIVTTSVVIDSREVKPDSAFFAIKGDRLDGHQFVPLALQTGKGAVVSQVPAGIGKDKGIVNVADTT